jgi:hypothetical protein
MSQNPEEYGACETFKIRRYEPLQVTNLHTGRRYMEERKAFNEMLR